MEKKPATNCVPCHRVTVSCGNAPPAQSCPGFPPPSCCTPQRDVFRDPVYDQSPIAAIPFVEKHFLCIDGDSGESQEDAFPNPAFAAVREAVELKR